MTWPTEPLPPEEPQKERKYGCFARVVTGLIILALLASSLAAVAWFVTRKEDSGKTTAELVAAQKPTAEVTQPALESTKVSTKPSATDPASPPDELINRIVLINEEGQVETIAPDGSESRVLSNEDFSYQYPAWSPDGSQIAALGSNNDGSGIFLLQDSDDPSTQREVLFGGGQSPFYIYWSPDSSKLSFLAARFGRGMSLNIVDAQEGEESHQLASGSPFYWNWTADSQQLLIHSGALSEDARLALINKGDGDQADEIVSPGYFQAPGISPSGHFWAYSQLKADGNSWLTIDNRQTGEKQSERHAGSVALSWSPVEDKLAFISSEGEQQASYWGPLRLIDAQTGDMRVLTTNLVLAFFWSPDGQKIATISVPLSNRLDEAIEVRDTKPRQVAKVGKSLLPVQQRAPHQFSVSVIDVTTGTGLELAQVAFPTSFLTQFLVFFDQYALSHNIWSPDSEFLVLPILIENASQLTVFATQSGRMNHIGHGQIAFWSPR